MIPTDSNEIKFSDKDIARFWSKVNKNGPLPDQSNPHYAGLDRCWVWTGEKIKCGYGRIRIGKKKLLAHRVAWVSKNGNIPHDGSAHGICAMHRCDRRECTNPAHLFLGSNFDNVRDKEVKGRGNQPSGDRNGSRVHPESRPRGEANTKAKLTTEKVIQIRAEHATGRFTQSVLSAMFGVCRSTIGRIIRHKYWAHVPDDRV
jgi:hypothetical protein